MGYQAKTARAGATLYSEVTDRIVAQIEEGILPWVGPWDDGKAALGLPRNAGTGRRYSGINVLILWHRLFEQGYGSQRWLTYRQAQALGGNVRKGEQGTTVCYADRFTPKDGENIPIGPDGEPRRIAFLKRFTVFNLDQCDGLEDMASSPVTTWNKALIIPRAQMLIEATGADIRVGGGEDYAPQDDYIHVPRPEHFHEPINWFRTALHELGHWTGHRSRLDRLPDSGFGSPAYAREELVALSGQSAPSATLQ
ncbi:Antirepressor [Sphingobium herbicidovorans NBRC 16415]|uniref:Antirepressor n=2 Tax=Sphingobium herbicidovorans TaxID=76947 RepID=A0A086P916_SPHHM|nr:ArdC-like ssDNA-binding domain-containing protein [Sphingobium herbicidovorans]KFG89884.1 Antirepressor [Sphingobium herbicidovorans NBRC 16415]